MSEVEEDPRPPRDTKAFNDPEAWGYCDFCAFDVAVFDGLRDEHRRIRNGNDSTPCAGSGRPPAERETPDATPRDQASLRKGMDRARSRQYWQRRRFLARAEAREKAEREAKYASIRALVAEVDCGD